MTFPNLAFSNFKNVFRTIKETVAPSEPSTLSLADIPNLKKEKKTPVSYSSPIQKTKYRVLYDSRQKKMHQVRIEQFRQFLENRMEQDIEMSQICQALGLSYTSFYRLVKAATKQTPTAYIRTYRLKKALHLLQNTNLDISSIAYEVGFSDPNYFSRVFKAEFGLAPSLARG